MQLHTVLSVYGVYGCIYGVNSMEYRSACMMAVLDGCLEKFLLSFYPLSLTFLISFLSGLQNIAPGKGLLLGLGFSFLLWPGIVVSC